MVVSVNNFEKQQQKWRKTISQKLKLALETNMLLVKTRQVCNLFQEPVEQPLLSFRIAEGKPDIKPDRHYVYFEQSYVEQKSLGWSELNGNFFYGGVIKVISTYILHFYFAHFRGTFGVGGCQSCFKTCVPQVNKNEPAFHKIQFWKFLTFGLTKIVNLCLNDGLKHPTVVAKWLRAFVKFM